MRGSAIFLLIACIGCLVCVNWTTPAAASWSQEWAQNYPPENVGSFTAMEFFILPGLTNVSFASPTSISIPSTTTTTWTSILPNSGYSLLTGPQANSALVTTYFSGYPMTGFTLDFVLWNGNTVVEHQEFTYVDGQWDGTYGTPLLNTPGQYNRSGVPIPGTILLLAPAAVGLLGLKKRLATVN